MARVYYVIPAQDAKEKYGLNPDDGIKRYALISLDGKGQLDTFVCWGYIPDNLQKEADKRNNDLRMLQDAIGKETNKIEEWENQYNPNDSVCHLVRFVC